MDLERLFKKFQLGESIFKGKFKLSKLTIECSHIKKEELYSIAIKNIAQQLSGKILEEHKSSIEEKDNGDHVQFNIDLMIVEKEKFKNIVEAAIITMSDDQIKRIKYGK